MSPPCQPRPHAALHRLLAAPLAALAAASVSFSAAADPAVQRSAAGWLIQPQGRSLAQLAAELAAQSGSELLGNPNALSQAPAPRWARWQAATLDEAWQALLDGTVNHARRCQGRGAAARCRLWLAGGAVRTAAAAAPFQVLPVAAVRTPQADPPGLFPDPPNN